MKIKELRKILNESSKYQEDEEVQVVLSVPAVGGLVTSKVNHATFGFDWDTGLLLHTDEKLVPKNEKQSIFEESYSLLMKIATESFIVKKENSFHKEAKRILINYGISEEQIKKYIHLYHKI